MSLSATGNSHRAELLTPALVWALGMDGTGASGLGGWWGRGAGWERGCDLGRDNGLAEAVLSACLLGPSPSVASCGPMTLAGTRGGGAVGRAVGTAGLC